MASDNFDFFKANREKIIKNHLGGFVVIHQQSVIGYFPTDIDAFKHMVGTELGTFLVQRCVPESEDIIEFYTRRVAFA